MLIAARTQRHTCQSCPSASRRSLEWPARPSARPAAHWRTAMQMGLRGSDQATKPSRANAQQGLLSRGSLARIMLRPLEWTRTNRLGAAPPFELMFTKTLASSDQIWVTAGCIVSFLRSPTSRRLAVGILATCKWNMWRAHWLHHHHYFLSVTCESGAVLLHQHPSLQQRRTD